MELTPEEGRVLGCLVEKQLTTPQQYPLTDNALIAACNQTTSRDPVVQYDLTAVRVAVRGLREKGLLRTVHRSGERSDKHQHELPAALELPEAEVAVLAVLLLRGPQTAAELRTRTERMHRFDAVAEVEQVLDTLVDRELATRLPRLPGRREDRFAEQLVGTSAAPAWAPPPAAPAEPEAVPAAPPQAHPAPAAPQPAIAPQQSASEPVADVAVLAAEVAALRREVAALRAEVADLRA